MLLGQFWCILDIDGRSVQLRAKKDVLFQFLCIPLLFIKHVKQICYILNNEQDYEHNPESESMELKS